MAEGSTGPGQTPDGDPEKHDKAPEEKRALQPDSLQAFLQNDPVVREISARLAEIPSIPPKVRRIATVFAAVAAVAGAALWFESRTGMVQSRIFPWLASRNNFKVVNGAASRTATSPDGIYDRKAGYTRGAAFDEKLKKDFDLVAQAQLQGTDGTLFGQRFAYPVYDEKAQPGLKIYDDNGQVLYDARFPQQAYEKFDDLPPLLVNSLLYVENRKVLDNVSNTRNHAVEVKRLFLAVLGKVGLVSTEAGGSTLAMQLEKLRHSPNGRSGDDIFEKMRQIVTGSERAYKDGPSTVEARRQTVLDYINAMPLAADPVFGEVNGYAVGMKAWFGEDLNEVNRLMALPPDKITDVELPAVAKAYRETLALIMAVKKPSAFIRNDRNALEKRIDTFLPSLERDGVITPRLRQAVAAQRLAFVPPAPLSAHANIYDLKSVTSLRIEFMQMLGRENVPDLHDLDQIDAHLSTTHNGRVSAAVQGTIESLGDPEIAKQKGLVGFRLLNENQAPNVIYSVSVNENTPKAVVQRVQVDNFEGQLNLSENSKLQLGSTSKARTVNLSENIFEDLYHEYSGKSPAELRVVVVPAKDRMTRWAIDYLLSPDTDKSLPAMLDAALERSYSANPHEAFFTGGGIHTFENFEPKDNGSVFTVRQALTKSINLPITRLGEDIREHMIYHVMKTDPDIFKDVNNPARKIYLDRFALREGQDFLEDAWKDLKGKGPEEMASALAAKTTRTPAHLAVIYRTVRPRASAEELEAFIRKEAKILPPKTDFAKLYEFYAPEKFSMDKQRDMLSLQDRGYLTNIHPMALWLAAHQAEKPDAKWDMAEWKNAVEESASARIAIYQWLMTPDKKEGQDNRIKTMLEEEAFTHIHAEYKAMGYPFNHLVPSLATFAMGVSGDTPAALAEFMSILQSDGIRKPVVRFTDVDLATGTPYERQYDRRIAPSTRVQSPEVSRSVLRAMKNVVDNGTAVRLKGKFVLSDGRVLDVYAKTGTGDNRLERRAKGGGLIASEAVDRTGTVMVGIGDKIEVTVTAYVKDDAGHYKFTSALPLQVVLAIAEDLRPVLDHAYGVDPELTKAKIAEIAAKAGAAQKKAAPAPAPIVR